jgi:class 3 adenylate cyclase/tetratricopeptide (TPR) repeat protein
MNCGAELAATCPGCGAAREAGDKFCSECGTSLTPAGTAAATPPVALHDPTEERRRATVLFADFSGYTAVAERLDPEDTKALVDAALGRLSREVTERDGHIDKYIGDNVMAVFGAPVAHEDDPERAVLAGLAMQDAMAEINAEIAGRAASHDVELALRVGINTGEVLAGRVGDSYTVIGDTVNLAARLQAAGRPGTVTVGDVTRRLTASTIAYRELEPLELKGKSEPIPAWEATGAIARNAGGARRAAPMLGRDDELLLLRSQFDRARREGRPCLVTVFGQAGVGKSRLLDELAAELAERDGDVETLVGRSPAYGASTAYAALAEIIRSRFGIAETAEPEDVLAHLRSGMSELEEAGGGEADVLRVTALVGRLLGVEADDDPAEDLDPKRTRDRIFAAVRAVLESLSRRGPIVIAIEDTHWADEGMLDLIEHLAGWSQGPILIVCLAREELLDRRPTWGGGRRNATAISLDPLGPEAARELVGALIGEAPVDEGLARKVAVQSGGNPLFAEEMINRLREEDGTDQGTLPDSVHAVLAARLDALDDEQRRLLQAASVVGQSFWEQTVDELLGGVGVETALAELVARDMLIQTSGRLEGEREFAFKHALVRDVAYETLPRAVRARRHHEVAHIVERRGGANPEAVAAMLAEHHNRAAELAAQSSFPAKELAELRRGAAEASRAAGDVAASLYSNAEALLHYRAALEHGLDPETRVQVEESLGDTAFRAGHVDAAIASWESALTFQSRQGAPRRIGELHRKIGSALWHKADREASISHFQEGIDLLKDGEPCRELIELYEEAAAVYVETGDNMLAIYAAEKAQRLAEALGQSATVSRTHLTFGRVFGRIGDTDRARQSLERALELARHAGPGQTIRALLALGQHLEIAEADYTGAGERYREGLRVADELGDVPAQIELHAALGRLAVHSARWSEVEDRAAASGELAEREGLSGQLCLPLFLEGVSAWRRGDWDRAEAKFGSSREIATAGGRSEVAFLAALWTGACHNDRGDLAGAAEKLLEAAEIGDRAGLIAQSAEALAGRAVVLALTSAAAEARTDVDAVEALLERASSPVAQAATATAAAAVVTDEQAAADSLRAAAQLWERAGRPVNGLRARLVLARRLAIVDRGAANEVLAEASALAERLDVPHLAAVAREAVADSGR